MFCRAFRLPACALLVAVAFGSCSVARADASVAGCRPATRGIVGMNAAQAIRTVTANIPQACGFTVSGVFAGVSFGDGWAILGTGTFDGHGGVHYSHDFQGVIINFYRAGRAEYVKLSSGTENVSSLWSGFGVTSKSVINAAGTRKWIRLPAPLKSGTYLYAPLDAAGLAADVAQGAQRPAAAPWHLDGTATVHGIRCTVLVNKATTADSPWGPEWLYVDTATGLPAQIGCYSQITRSEHVTSFFSNWGHAAAVTPPPASEIVAG
jgi:hypothetical protein